MRRFFAKNILFVIALNLLVKPVWVFMIDRTVQNRVGTEYGSYQALFNLGVIFQILLDFGINHYTNKTLAEHPQHIKKLFPALMTVRIALSLLYIAILIIVAVVLGYHGRELYLLGGISLIQFFNAGLQFIRSNFSGLHRFKMEGVLSILDRVLMIIVCGFLLLYYKNDFKIAWFVAAQIVCYAAAMVIGYILLTRLAKVSFHFSLNYRLINFHFRKTIPFAILIFLMSIYTRVDMLLVERLSTDKNEAALYAAAYRLLDVANMIGLMVAAMLLPIFGGMIARKENMQGLIRLCVNGLLPIAILLVVSALMFHTEIMSTLYVNLPENSGWVFAWLMAAFPAFSLSNVYSTLLTANGNLKLMIRIALFAVVINIALNLILIPNFQALGAAIAAFSTQTVVAVCFILFAKKELRLQKDWRWVFSFLYFLGLMIITAVVMDQLAIHWILKLFIINLAGAAMIFLFRFIDISKLKNLKGSK